MAEHDPDDLLASIPLAAVLGIELVETGPQQVVATMPWSSDKTTVGGRLHGGALMAFADTTGALCAFLHLPPGATTATIESKTNFLRGVGTGVVTATSRPVHVGTTTIVVTTEVLDERGKAVALVTQTQIVIPAPA
jgi:uncharacterized protein (TIGR00369 family)